MQNMDFGKLLIAVGAVIVLVGVIVYLGGKVNYFGLGRLPGDIRIERENFKFYFPLATSILISIILSAMLYLVSRLR